MSTDQTRPIIIKRKKVSGGDGHHGGAWKVAYADFVTAMMAFFLLMWLLNATSEDQRKGLADFFDPSLPISRNSAGGAGMLAGDTVFTEEDAAGSRKEGVRPKPTHAPPGEQYGDASASPDLPTDPDSDTDHGGNPLVGAAPKTLDGTADGGEAAGDTGAGQGQGNLAEIGNSLIDQIVSRGEGGLLDHFSMRTTPEGLLIEIVDIDDRALFSSGAAEPDPVLRELIDILVPVLERTTNDIAVVGHTDATPFGRNAAYSNWELSADRANTARRLLTAAGLPADRIVRVSGKAATSPITSDPQDSRNRRIAITLLRGDAPN